MVAASERPRWICSPACRWLSIVPGSLPCTATAGSPGQSASTSNWPPPTRGTGGLRWTSAVSPRWPETGARSDDALRKPSGSSASAGTRRPEEASPRRYPCSRVGGLRIIWLVPRRWGLPPLVGVGSVCRRNVSGRDGLLAILEALDASLPPRTRLHLFGVKGSAIRRLAGHPRVHSVDSMAWDLNARYAARSPNDLTHRIARMRSWYGRQVEALPQEANGQVPAKEPAARWRQRTARTRRAAEGLRQVVLWLPEAAVAVLDSGRLEGESRSERARRVITEWAAVAPKRP